VMEGTTIAALATAPAPAGVAIVRVSGPRCRLVLKSVFNGKKDPIKLPRTLVFGDILDFNSGVSIDKGLAVFMPAPWSFTGEDVVEFQFHGSPVLVQRVLRSLYAYGVQPAAAGEFTKRAFLNGKLDLAQAEAIADVVHAKSEEQLRFAGEQLRGRLSQAIELIGEPLRDALAELEATIDFPEEDIKPDALDAIAARIGIARTKIQGLVATYSFGSLVREGVRVLLCGRPNSGKSSLLNLLLGKRRAIVSDISGTTRDLIEDEATLSGHKFVFCDSAGIRETSDQIERIGVELAKERIPWADLVLLVVDATDTTNSWQHTLDLLVAQGKKIWMIVNKIDLNRDALVQFSESASLCEQKFFISVKTGDGLNGLLEALVDDVAKQMPEKNEAGEVVTNERHRDCLIRAERALTASVDGLQGRGVPLSITVADLKDALVALDEVIGRTYTEDILGRIFSKFCIGK
jgi:tRNA modification GTPase